MPPQKTPFKHWLSLILAILAVIAFIACSPQQGGIIYEMMGGGGYSTGNSTGAIPPTTPMMEDYALSGQAPPTRYMSAPSSMPYYPYPYPGGGATAKDTREFLKQSYNATLRTRDVNSLTARVVTTVRGHDGRVDNTQSSEKYGYVQFVIPVTEFESFKQEVEGMVGARFLKVEMSAQNLLPQKQSIEERQKSVEQKIADLKVTRAQIVSAHAAAVKNLQSRIDDNMAEINTLVKISNEPGVQARINALRADRDSLKTQLSNENTLYTNKLKSYDSQIANASTTLTTVKTQDQNLLDNVATVNGTISLQWIRYWEMARLYLPGNW